MSFQFALLRPTSPHSNPPKCYDSHCAAETTPICDKYRNPSAPIPLTSRFIVLEHFIYTAEHHPQCTAYTQSAGAAFGEKRASSQSEKSTTTQTNIVFFWLGNFGCVNYVDRFRDYNRESETEWTY